MKRIHCVLTITVILLMTTCGGTLMAQNDSTSTKSDSTITQNQPRKKWRLCPKRDTAATTVVTDNLQPDSLRKLNKTIADLQQDSAKKQKIIDSLNNEIKQRDSALTSQMVAAFGKQFLDANNFFCWAVMQSPLYYSYNAQRVSHSLETAHVMGYDKRDCKLNWVYNVFYDLLVNYEKYTNELVKLVDNVCRQFDLGVINRELEKIKFEDALARTAYQKMRHTGIDGKFRHIYYLDYQIERLRSFFSSDTDFKKKNFVEVRNFLLSGSSKDRH